MGHKFEKCIKSYQESALKKVDVFRGEIRGEQKRIQKFVKNLRKSLKGEKS